MSHRLFARIRALVPVALAIVLLPVAWAQQPVAGTEQPKFVAAPQARLTAPTDSHQVTRRLQESVIELSELGSLIEARGLSVRCGCPIGPPPPPVKPSVRVPRESLDELHRAIQVLTVIEQNARRGLGTEVDGVSAR
jgi:hypothetical protein